MRTVFASFVLSIALTSPIWAQTPSPFVRGATQMENILPPTPEAASAVKYADVPFSHSLGVAEVDIPFFTLQGRELSLPIGLHYRCGGVKVDEIGGVAGLGWSLQAGGVITRSVVDMPDEFSSAELTHQMPSGTLLSDLENQVDNTATLAYLKNNLWHHVDSGLDRYSFDICGLCGTFVIRDDGSVFLLSGDGVEISFSHVGNTSAIDTFTVKGPDGTVYVLSYKETGTHLGTSESSFTPTSGEADHWEATTAWYLSSVTSRSGAETAQFTYTSGGTWNRNINPLIKTLTFEEWGSGSSSSDGVSSQFIANSYTTRVLTSITLGGFTVSFTYASDTGNHNHDVRSWVSAQNNPSRLTAISVLAPGGSTLRTLSVGTVKDLRDGRIVLGSLRLYSGTSGGTLEDRWDFTYNTRIRSISHYSQDWYGYFNASNEVIPWVGEEPFAIYNSLCPYDIVMSYGTPTLSLAHGTPNPSVSHYMSLKKVDHDGAVTEFTYEGNNITTGLNPLSVGIRVKRITVSDADGVKRVRSFSYADLYADGPVQVSESQYTTVSGQQGVHPPSVNQYTWSFGVHETPVGDGPTVRDTRIHYGTVTEDVTENGQSSSAGARTVYHYSTSGIRGNSTSTLSRFPSMWSSVYGPGTYAPQAVSPWTGVREGYEESGPASGALLTRKEEYAWNGSTYSLVSSVDYSYGTLSRSAVLVDYRATQVMQRITAGNVQYADIYHYPIWAHSAPDRRPVRTVSVGYHASGNDSTVVETNYLPRTNLNSPLRVGSETWSEGGVTRTMQNNYADTWHGTAPSWVTALVGQHALNIPLKRKLTYNQPGGNYPPLEEVKAESHEYGWYSVGGVQRLLPSRVAESTKGVENWSEEVLSRNALGNVEEVKEHGKPSTVVLWSYGGLYPVAVVENAVSGDVSAALGQSFITTLASASSPTAAQLNTLATLRTLLPSSHVTTYTFSPGVGITSVTDPAGVKTAYEYDGAGRLTLVKDASGNALEGYTYSLLNNGGTGRLNIRSRRYRTQTGSVYTEDVRWWSTLGLVLEDVGIAASGVGNADLVTAYGSDFLLHDDVKTWLPYPVNNTGGNYQSGAAAASANYHGNAKAYTYKRYEQSARDKVLSEALPGYAEVHQTEYAENVKASFPKLRWVDGTGVVTNGTYNAWELLEERAVDADGRRAAKVSDHYGRLLGTLQGNTVPSPADPSPTYYIYDRYDRLRAVAGSGIPLTDTLKMWRYSYDSHDRLSSKGIPGSVREYYTYDNEGRIIEVRRGSELLQTTYDAFGRVLTVTLTQGSGTPVLLEQHYYDSYPSVASTLVLQAAGSQGWSGPTKGLETYSSIAELDSDGVVTGMHQTVFLYDAKERLVKSLTQDPQGGSLLEETTYTFPGEPATVTTSYTHGSVTDILTQTLDYDIRGRQTALTASLSAGGTTVAGGSVQYSYDALGRPSGSTSTVTGGVTLTTEDSYTLRGNLASRTVKKGGVNLFAESLTYDGASGITGVTPSYTGLITKKQETWTFPGSVTDTHAEGYAYDYAGRMTRSGSATSPVAYTYDVRGNVLTAGGSSYTYSGDKLTALTPAGQSAVSFSHDAYGRMTADGLSGTTISYNHLNLPAKVSQNGNDLAKYSYLASGSKSKAENGSGVGLVYRGSLIYRKASDGTLTLEGASMPEGRLTVNGVRWYVKDHLGSVRAVVDGSTGGLLTVTDYEAYGKDTANATASSYLSAAPAGETFRDHFTGKEDQDPDFGTAYTDFGARQYSPALRRWLVPDPLSEKYYGISPYAYCAGDPVNLVDPDGRVIFPWYYIYMSIARSLETSGRRNTVKEIGYSMQEPYKAMVNGMPTLKYNNISVSSSNYAINLGNRLGVIKNEPGNEKNALRHVIWQGLLTTRFGAHHANRIGRAHEDRNVDTNQHKWNDKEDADAVADLLNNTIGQSIGLDEKMSNQDVVKKVLQVFQSAGLWVVVRREDNSYSVERKRISEGELDELLNYLMQLNSNGLQNN